MKTDPEFLAMKSIKRSLDSLPDEATRKRVVDWTVAKTYHGDTPEYGSPTTTKESSNVCQGQAVQGH